MWTLLVIDDDPLVRRLFSSGFSDSDVNVLSADSATSGLALAAETHPDVVILDVFLPDTSGLDAFERFRALDPHLPVIFITAGTGSDTVIEAMKRGAFDYLVKPLDFGQVRELVARAVESRRLMRTPVRFSHEDPAQPADRLVGQCPQMQEVYKAIGRVASQNVTVLIRGESGTGKELIARAIYQHSRRAQGPFLAINCAAIPDSLLESELFGHEKGAFTGAESRRIGKFEQCVGGTLFLDEIGDMSLVTQSKLLRVLQEQKFQRVGGNETIETDARIIAATNRDLESMIVDGQFRADLYYRLSVFEMRVPPLRERTNDLPNLLEHFLRTFNQELGKDVQGMSPEALDIILQYPWPGNVRELQSVLKQTLLNATGPVIVPAFLPEALLSDSRIPASDSGESWALEPFVDDQIRLGSQSLHADTIALVERALLTRVLQHTRGNQAHAARILGITRGSLRHKIRGLGIRLSSQVECDA